MNKTPLSFLVTFFFITFSLQLHGQGDCEQTISHASDEFNAGHFYSIPGILKDCLDHGNLSTDQEIRAYMMLCQAYLLINFLWYSCHHVFRKTHGYFVLGRIALSNTRTFHV